MPTNDDKKIKEILKAAKTIAVIGASNKPWRDSNRITGYLKRNGYNVIQVNPNYTEIDGDICYPDLKSIGKPIDIIDVFRSPDAVDEIVDDAIGVKAKVIWLQLGVVNESAAKRAESTGIQVIMDRCIMVDHSRLMRQVRKEL